MLELNSPKTTKPKTIHINNKNIESHLGYMLKNISFKPKIYMPYQQYTYTIVVCNKNK